MKYTVLNSEIFGAPKKRERVVIVGFKKDLNINYEFVETIIFMGNDYVAL